MRYALGLLFLITSSVGATTVTLDFESLDDVSFLDADAVPGSEGYVPVVENGFVLDASTSAFNVGISTDVSGNNFLAFCGWCSEGGPNGVGAENVSIYAENGSAFNLQSIDTLTFGGNGSFFFTGQITGYIDGVAQAYAVISSEPATLTFDESWSNLTKINIAWNTPYSLPDLMGTGVDNIVLQVVPVPAAVWLFGSALAGLGWMSRKQTS